MPVERRLKRVEDYLQHQLAPMIIDIDESLSALDDKYKKLLKLLEQKLK